MIVGSRCQAVAYPVVLVAAAAGSWTVGVGSENARKPNADEEDSTPSSQVPIRTITTGLHIKNLTLKTGHFSLRVSAHRWAVKKRATFYNRIIQRKFSL